METRDILDVNGNVIGTLTLPDGTSEAKWAAMLAEFKFSNPVPTQTQIIEGKIQAAKDFGNKLLTDISAEHIAMGIMASSEFKNIIDYTMDVRLYATTGNLLAALQEMDALLQAGVPEQYAPYVTPARMTANRNKIAQYLGVSEI